MDFIQRQAKKLIDKAKDLIRKTDDEVLKGSLFDAEVFYKGYKPGEGKFREGLLEDALNDLEKHISRVQRNNAGDNMKEKLIGKSMKELKNLLGDKKENKNNKAPYLSKARTSEMEKENIKQRENAWKNDEEGAYEIRAYIGYSGKYEMIQVYARNLKEAIKEAKKEMEGEGLITRMKIEEEETGNNWDINRP